VQAAILPVGAYPPFLNTRAPFLSGRVVIAVDPRSASSALRERLYDLLIFCQSVPDSRRNSYLPPCQVGRAPEGAAVAEGIQSDDPSFAVGDHCVGEDGDLKESSEFWISPSRRGGAIAASVAFAETLSQKAHQKVER
jgi:hypothetical protein